jgi:aminoglycoside phosphotransferase (APT) family kinase protein
MYSCVITWIRPNVPTTHTPTSASATTPTTFLHGDWKLGNLGVAPGRTVLLDWTYPGIGPIAYFVFGRKPAV